ncbi:hypothetical protein DICVIV_04417 [Dictyocaulus viviparus]|uniref:K Homology domain-containing protein n=1 Tax=Dictyocaulus viviparus TaxID=29172 RepID=A0A0D8XYA7_DICVI|nr:hypothetical protein DICVIV_04417 [Dictyocaulus viviparus]
MRSQEISSLSNVFTSLSLGRKVLSFPDMNKRSDVINIRGEKSEVDKVYKQLQAIGKDLVCC